MACCCPKDVPRHRNPFESALDCIEKNDATFTVFFNDGSTGPILFSTLYDFNDSSLTATPDSNHSVVEVIALSNVLGITTNDADAFDCITD
jgi:hypothetical protein